MKMGSNNEIASRPGEAKCFSRPLFPWFGDGTQTCAWPFLAGDLMFMQNEIAGVEIRLDG
jgi:hypothetical protein